MHEPPSPPLQLHNNVFVLYIFIYYILLNYPNEPNEIIALITASYIFLSQLGTHFFGPGCIVCSMKAPIEITSTIIVCICMYLYIYVGVSRLMYVCRCMVFGVPLGVPVYWDEQLPVCTGRSITDNSNNNI